VSGKKHSLFDMIDRAEERVAELEVALEQIRDFKFGWRGTNAHEDVAKLQKIAQQAVIKNFFTTEDSK